MDKEIKEYLLDTNICIDYLNAFKKKEAKRNPREIYILKIFKDLGKTAYFYVSQATVAELRFGAEKSQSREKNLLNIERFIKVIPEIKVDDVVWESFVKIKAELSQKGKMIADMDLLIAATAKRHNMILVSNDKDMNNLDFLEKNPIERKNWLKD